MNFVFNAKILTKEKHEINKKKKHTKFCRVFFCNI